MQLTWETVAPVVERLVGLAGPLGDAVDLGGSSRTLVWRVRAGDAPYVVKAHRPGEDGWAREAAGLEALRGSGVVPELVGCDDEARVLVMEDLGSGPHLADALLADDPTLAEDRLLAWVDALAGVHLASTPERQEAFAAGVRARGGDPEGAVEEGLSVERYAEVLPELGVPGELLEGVREGLARLPGLLSERKRGYPAPRLHFPSGNVISPDDVCPDNNALVGERLVLLDLEGAQLLHPAWDLAYLTVPWPSCWCAWDLPDPVVATALERYAARTGTDLAAELRLTSLAWSVISSGWFLPRALENAASEEPDRIPGRRSMIQHRLARAAASYAPPELDALPRFAARLHAVLERRWGPVSLPLAPAWRGTTLAP